MMPIVISIAIIMQIGMTISIMVVWQMVRRNNPAAMPKIFFASMIVRLLFSLILFALGLFFVRHDIEMVKIFSAVFIAVYLLLLIVDTAYFYCTSQLKK